MVDPPPAPRDPLLDDPLFADLVEAKPAPDLVLGSDAPPPPPAPLPVAVPVRPGPAGDGDRPSRAKPVRPRSALPPPPEARESGPRRPQVFAACGVIGCLGVAFFGALGFIAFAALSLLSGVAERVGGPSRPVTDRPGPVLPTTFAVEKGKGVIPLPAPVDAVGRAAGGRYLLLRTPRNGQVHVFDPNVGQLVRVFDLGSPQALFAGSAAKLFVYRPTAAGAELERWNLETGTKEKDAPRPAGIVNPDALAVGAGVDGPVYLVSVPENGRASIRVLDPETLTETAAHTFDGWRGGTRVHVRPSDDGALLGVTTPSGAQLVRFAPGGGPTLTPLTSRVGAAPALATPARDGLLVFTPNGVFDPASGMAKASRGQYTLPTAHGSGLFLSLQRNAGATLAGAIRLHPAATPEDHVELDGVTVPPGLQATDTRDVPPDQRVHFWPAAGLAAVISTGSETTLTLTKVDVAEALAGLSDPYLVIGSDPPAWAARGEEWRYRPVTWVAPETAATLTLVHGPKGMQYRGGEFVWTPGPDAPPTSEVRVRATAGGRTTEQRFRVTVVAAPDDE